MLTLKSEDRLINRLKSLSELELASVLTELREHLAKNKMLHLLEHVLYEETAADVRDEMKEVEKELDDLTWKKDRYVDMISEACTALEELDLQDDPKDLKEDIDTIIENLNEIP